MTPPRAAERPPRCVPACSRRVDAPRIGVSGLDADRRPPRAAPTRAHSHGVRSRGLGQAAHDVALQGDRPRPAGVRPPPYVLGTCPRSPRSSRSRRPARCAGRSTTASRAGMAGVGVGSVLLVPFGRRRILGLVVDVATKRAAAGAARRAARRARGRRPARARRARAVGRPSSTARRPRAASRSCCRRAPARPDAAPGARTRSCSRPSSPGRPAARCAGRRPRASAPRQHAALAGARRGPADRGRAAAARRCGTAPCRASTRRGLVSARRAGGRAPPGGRRARRRRRAPPRGSRRPDGRPARRRSTRSRRRCASARHAQRPAPRRHRQRQDRGLPARGRDRRSSRGARRSCSCPRSRSRRRPRGASSERFGDRVAVLHSKLGLGERYDEWQRLRTRRGARLRRAALGGVRAAARPRADRHRRGARLRLQAGGRPPLRRARGGRAPGARRPAPCCWRAARRRGPRAGRRCGASTLPERVDGRSLPPVELLDMRGLRHALHPRLARARWSEVRRRGAKAIVLVNRRGWSPFVVCRDCGRAWMCPHCDVTLTLHRAGAPARSRATTAATASRPPQSCPDCGSTVGGAPRRRHAAARGRAASRRSRRCPSSAWTRDAARRKGTASPSCWPLRRRARGRAGRDADGRAGPRLPRRSSWRSCRTPTRRCASPTSARRSAPSRSSRSSPGAAAAARPAAACWCRRCAPTPRCLRHAARARRARASWPRRSSAAARCAIRRSRTLIRVSPPRRERGRRRPRGRRRVRGGCSARARRARAGAAVPRSRTCSAAPGDEGPGRGRPRWPPSAPPSRRWCRPRAQARQARGRRRSAVSGESDPDCPFCRRIRGREVPPRDAPDRRGDPGRAPGQPRPLPGAAEAPRARLLRAHGPGAERHAGAALGAARAAGGRARHEVLQRRRERRRRRGPDRRPRARAPDPALRGRRAGSPRRRALGDPRPRPRTGTSSSGRRPAQTRC